MLSQAEISLFQCRQCEPNANSYIEFRIDITGSSDEFEGLLVTGFRMGVQPEEERQYFSQTFDLESAKHLCDFLNYALKDKNT